MSHSLIPHYARPFRFVAAGHADTVEQDTYDDVAMCVGVLLSTTVNQRLELPEYGVPELPFLTTLPENDIIGAVARWEDRAEVLLTEERADDDELVRLVRVIFTKQRHD